MTRLLDNTLAADTLAENGAWIRACGVAHLGRGELEAYGKAKGRSRQAVSRWARAWQGYAWLKGCWYADLTLRVFPHPLILRREPSVSFYCLTLEHFTEVAEYQAVHEVAPYDLFFHLFTAWQEGVSAKEMRRIMDDEATGGKGQPEWWRRAGGIVSELGKLKGDFGVPEEVGLLAGLTYEALKEWMEQGYD